MTKLQIEYIRLSFSLFVFIFIITLLFFHINQVQLQWFTALTKVMTIPALLLSIAIPLLMIVDLFRKKVADKSIFNLTFFISVISILLLLFAIYILK